MSYLFLKSSKQTRKYFNLINLLKNNKSSISTLQNIKINNHNQKKIQNFVNNKEFSTLPPIDPIGKGILDVNTFEVVCSDTIESLCDYFEELVESSTHLQNSDITYGDGVLTVRFGNPHGTYVINRQTPNRQVWLSSPKSGPKRYDFVETSKNEGYWIYRHENETLHQLLQREIKSIVGKDVEFESLPNGRRE